MSRYISTGYSGQHFLNLTPSEAIPRRGLRTEGNKLSEPRVPRVKSLLKRKY